MQVKHTSSLVNYWVNAQVMLLQSGQLVLAV